MGSNSEYDLRNKFLLGAPISEVQLYFDNLHRLSLKDEKYKKVYLDDYNFFKNRFEDHEENKNGGNLEVLEGGGFWSLLRNMIFGYKPKPRDYECPNIMDRYEEKNKKGFCQDVDFRLKEIKDELEISSKVKLKSKVVNLIKEFIGMILCCDHNFSQNVLKLVISIIKIIKHTFLMLKFTIAYVKELIENNPELIDFEFKKDYGKLVKSKEIPMRKNILKHLEDDYKKEIINRNSMYKTAFIMTFLREEDRYMGCATSCAPYVRNLK
jgi:hypothetical protein